MQPYHTKGEKCEGRMLLTLISDNQSVVTAGKVFEPIPLQMMRGRLQEFLSQLFTVYRYYL